MKEECWLVCRIIDCGPLEICEVRMMAILVESSQFNQENMKAYFSVFLFS